MTLGPNARQSARELADPDFSLSVPPQAKATIKALLLHIEELERVQGKGAPVAEEVSPRG